MTSMEQRELLKLLTQNFEYEMKNVELQAEIFIRDYSIKSKDLQLLRMSQHRSLCDTLIYQQRRLIQGIHQSVNIPKRQIIVVFQIIKF